LEKVETLVAALIRHAENHRRWVWFGTLRSFCGAAISTTLPVPQARYRTQSLFSAMRPLLRAGPSGTPKGRDLRLGHHALSDLRLWPRLSDHAFLGRALWPAPKDAVVRTDVSTSGWGATCNGLVPFKGFHGPKCRQLHIKEHKLAAVRLAMQSFLLLLRMDGTVVCMMKYSMVGVHVVNNGTSHLEAMVQELHTLHALCERKKLDLRASWLPSAVSYLAEKVSRHPDRTDWSTAQFGASSARTRHSRWTSSRRSGTASAATTTRRPPTPGLKASTP